MKALELGLFLEGSIARSSPLMQIPLSSKTSKQNTKRPKKTLKGKSNNNTLWNNLKDCIPKAKFHCIKNQKQQIY